ncbi:hypothetical protein JX265_012218 [Neoarthrinium moseri]|uniref:Uncharacterized protein n=1 Tax=Neoarthrinium moseri TaxID=1658444 RepID=A0A9P9WAL0_9PEZI|nr:uncharacterized protein JN550_006953 [Neoarthrinium moseri]KAI1843210.1 hypothetical protein JX266_010564 [Neoarthrinium moseri]KAI1855773.1 hypothetical protein JX265_012218 [Neoarthrinium moseri]KAI1867812.1 hypothetical protein JN550_006953 [Neoarthrinium moseri]
MKISPLVVLSASLAIAAADETITISGFSYRGQDPAGDKISFILSADDISCTASAYDVPGYGYACSEPDFTFDILDKNGTELSADFSIRMNGPLPTILDQVGTSTATLTPSN